MKRIFAASALVLVSLPVAAGEEASNDAGAAAHGASILLPFKRDLQAALRQALAEGPEERERRKNGLRSINFGGICWACHRGCQNSR